ncbi:hypothetical protein BN1723_004092 [Verticillium longisporum]|uniref:Amine oxidase n=1 Tax=Verticillium longisporum TaxID=100787 RepID=A0A0G4MMA3_VERLO|nr:hypothetical protein BN1723_004092 [Verticillium longisporum]
MTQIPHPLSALTVAESDVARDAVLAAHEGAVLKFRLIFLLEPPKAKVITFLDLEHAGKVIAETPRPIRTAQVHYDVIGGDNAAVYQESVVDLSSKKVVDTKIVAKVHQASLVLSEFDDLVNACKESPLFQEKIAALELPKDFEVVVEPWPYGAPEVADGDTRLFQALIFARDTSSGNPDTNFYAFPLPLIPVMDAATKKIIRIDDLATGGKGDPLKGKHTSPLCLSTAKRQNMFQSSWLVAFAVTDGNLIQWQKWSMRVTFNPREGAVVHDIRFDGRSVLYRLSMSDMTVPYADPRPPFHRKQAFDFGDGGLGNAVNNLTLGCDCLGVIKYFDGVLTGADGSANDTKNVICLHEQDAGINWKHTNWRTGRAVVTRRRELVVQFIITLANYEYIFNYKFDQAAGITVEARATGIVSVVNIDPGKTSPWGNIVSPGALAQNHQHIFCVRIDPAIDGQQNTVVQEESLPVRMDKRTNPNGNYYEVRQTPITTSVGLDAVPQNHRVFKIQNTNKLNPISGKPVAYKIAPPATQLLLADPNSVQAKRALFAQHHLWVTKFRDDELYAGGRYTLMSKNEVDGVSDAADRNDDVLNEDVVVWSVFGLTHNPRIEDWPVMPVEIMQLHITPSDFFTRNPAIDVPSDKDFGSKPTEGLPNAAMAVFETVAFIAQRARETTLEASVVLLVAVPIVYVVINEFIRSNARIKGMKGPRGLPLVGNLWDIRTNAADQYRHWAKKHGDVYQATTHVEEEVSRFRSTTGNYQDYVPLLRLNPFNFHSAKAREMRHRRDVYLTALNQGLEQRMKDGTYKPCIQANVMLDEEARLNAEELTSISLTMLSGGLDTLTTLVAWFIGLLVHKPEIQEKAIQEIRAFFGDNEPLCDSEDDQKCPYMVALVRESLRYFTVLRLALPRATVRDVVHNGITIPKGSTLFLNAWACNMDGNVWSDPEAFRPERWLEQPDAPLFTYGMGYRMCAGSLLANRELYLIYMRMINSFKIVKYDDFESDPVKGNADPTSLVALPKRYRAKFVPRNETALRKALDSTRQVESEKL